MKILAIGAALTDILVDVPSDSFFDKLGFAKGSMTYVDKLTQGEILGAIGALDYQVETGGSAANCAGIVAHYGGEAAFIGCVGDDQIGEIYADKLRVRGVETKLWKSEKEGSGTVAAMVSKDGERTFATYLGASADVSADNLSREMFEGFDFLFVEGYLVYNKPYLERAMALAKEVGAQVAFDMASFNVVEQSRAYMGEIIERYVDIVFANEQEAEAFGDLSVCDGIVVLKLGSKGALVEFGGERFSVSADRSVVVRDKTGAGDAFAGGFLYGLASGFDIQRCAELGARAADKVVQVVGAHLEN